MKPRAVLGAVAVVLLILGAASYYVLVSSSDGTTATVTRTINATSTTSSGPSTTIAAIAAIVDKIHGAEYDGLANGNILAATSAVIGSGSISWDNSVPSLKATVTSAPGDGAVWQIPLSTFHSGTFQVTFSTNAPISPYQEIFVGFWDGPLGGFRLLIGPQNGVAFGMVGNDFNSSTYPWNSRMYIWKQGLPTYSPIFPSDVTNPHVYRIVWTGAQASFYIDGILIWSGGGVPTSGVYLRLGITNQTNQTDVHCYPVTVTFTLASVS